MVVMEDENVDAILAGRRPSQLVSSSHPPATVNRPKTTPTSTRASSAGATRSGSPASLIRTGWASPTHSRPAGSSVPMPAPVQVPAHRDPREVIVVPEDDDEPLTSSGSKPKGSAKKNRVYTPEEEAA